MAATAPDRRGDSVGYGVRRFRRLILASVMAIATAAASSTTANAQRVSFIRDAEIEGLLRDYAVPIIRAAGVGESAVRIYIIGSPQFNAFVASGRRIFINAGVLMQAKTPNEVIGVIAHETGHIAGGHLARQRLELQNAQAMAILATLLGAGAVAAGAVAGSAGDGAAAGQAIMMGGQSMVERSLLAYQRTEEQAADRAAVTYLNATGQSARGMLATFAALADQAFLTTKYADPYAQSHPMPRERIAALENLARQSKYFDKTDPPELQFRHDLARAKLYGHLDHPSSVMRRYPPSDSSLPARYARTIAQMRSGDYRNALAGAEALIAALPNHAYFWELKGDLLLKSGRAREAVAPLQKAVSLDPNSGLLKVLLGEALMATDDPKLLDQAINLMSQGLQSETEFGGGYRRLAIAYGKAGRVAEAELATAQGYFNDGDYEMAKRFAQRAQQGLKTGSPGWLRADDIIRFRPQ
jgi:predicted Zn-dependent protease